MSTLIAVLVFLLCLAIVYWLWHWYRTTPTDEPTPLPRARNAHHHALIRRELELTRQGGFLSVVADREQRWLRHMATVKVGPNLRVWAVEMAKRHSNPRVRVGFQRLDWLTALMVVRYGEAEDYWPAEFARSDEERAVQWLGGDTPRRVGYLPPISEGSGP